MQSTEAATVSRRVERGEIEIQSLRIGGDATPFRLLNEEWITTHFALEAKDRETLGDPENFILRKGGHVFTAYFQGAAAGCVALIPAETGRYELSKMAVSPVLRGHGIGRILIEYVIAQARVLGASFLFLGSSSRLPAAVRLYESVGFHHVPADRLPPIHYVRSDVFMEMQL